MAKFLDDNGLLYLWTTIKNTFAKPSDIPTQTSQLTNNSNFVSDADYVHTDNNFTDEDVTKLNGIAAGAQVNVIETIRVNGTIQTPSGKSVNITVPTTVSALTNDSNYQTGAQVTAAIASAVGEITGVSFEIVSELPATGVNGTIYLVATARENSYDEYIYINSTWEQIGSTSVDLTGYWNNTNLTAITNAEIDTIVAS